MGSPTVRRDTIGSLIRERREKEEEVRLLQNEIYRFIVETGDVTGSAADHCRTIMVTTTDS